VEKMEKEKKKTSDTSHHFRVLNLRYKTKSFFKVTIVYAL
jgi:hypothetical protein